MGNRHDSALALSVSLSLCLSLSLSLSSPLRASPHSPRPPRRALRARHCVWSHSSSIIASRYSSPLSLLRTKTLSAPASCMLCSHASTRSYTCTPSASLSARRSARNFRDSRQPWHFCPLWTESLVHFRPGLTETRRPPGGAFSKWKTETRADGRAGRHITPAQSEWQPVMRVHDALAMTAGLRGVATCPLAPRTRPNGRHVARCLVCCTCRTETLRSDTPGARGRPAAVPRPSPRTNRTRRVPHPVLIGHTLSPPSDTHSVGLR